MAKKLTEIKCEACEGGVEPLSSEEIWDLQRSVPDWSISLKWIDEKPNSCLTKTFNFDDFAKALKVVNLMGKIAEKEGHHPDIGFGWGYVNILLMTHAIGGLSINDFVVAAKINQAMEKMK